MKIRCSLRISYEVHFYLNAMKKMIQAPKNQENFLKPCVKCHKLTMLTCFFKSKLMR